MESVRKFYSILKKILRNFRENFKKYENLIQILREFHAVFMRISLICKEIFIQILENFIQF